MKRDRRDAVCRAIEVANAAVKKAEAALLKAFPIDSEVRFVLSSNQISYSRGTVIAHHYSSGFGLIRVRVASPKQIVRDVPFTDILP